MQLRETRTLSWKRKVFYSLRPQKVTQSRLTKEFERKRRGGRKGRTASETEVGTQKRDDNKTYLLWIGYEIIWLLASDPTRIRSWFVLQMILSSLLFLLLLLLLFLLLLLLSLLVAWNPKQDWPSKPTVMVPTNMARNQTSSCCHWLSVQELRPASVVPIRCKLPLHGSSAWDQVANDPTALQLWHLLVDADLQ